MVNASPLITLAKIGQLQLLVRPGVMGTLGVVVLARLEGRIESASGVLRALRDAGLYLDDALLRRVLGQTVGESWEA